MSELQESDWCWVGTATTKFNIRVVHVDDENVTKLEDIFVIDDDEKLASKEDILGLEDNGGEGQCSGDV